MTRKRQTGYAVILTTLALVALLGFMGFGIDMGMLRYQKRLQQTAADAAAIAGANDLANVCLGTPCDAVTGAAHAAATANGFTDGSNNVTVAVNNGPTYWGADPHTGDARYVEVVITAVHPTYFMRIVGINNETVMARAEATWNGGGSTNSTCLVTLGNWNKNEIGVDAQGSVTLNATQCGIEDNGTFNTTGGGGSNQLQINTCSFNVAGGTNNSPGGNNVYCDGQVMIPSYKMPTVGDPLSYLSSQTPCLKGYTCTGGPDFSNGGGGKGKGGGSGSNVTVPCPGGVCNYSHINLNGGNITFSPGIYIIDGAGSVSNPGFQCAGNPNISGNGVMFFFTNSATVQCSGTGTIDLHAPSATNCPSCPSTSYYGILMWQDPNDPSTGKLNISGNSCTSGPATLGPVLTGNSGGSSGAGYDGVLYFPADQLWFSGSTSGTVTGIDVAAAVSDSLCMSGNADLNFIGTTGLGPGPLLSTLSKPVLVE
jgi:hypothetical protein